MALNSENKSPFVPIYRKLFDEYKQDIITQKFQPGDRIASINKIMARHQVSRETAKLVLKMLAEEGLIVQKAGLGSYVADLGPREKVWAVLIPAFSIMTEQLISLIRREAFKLQRRLDHFVYYYNWEEEIRLVGTLINQRYEAIIVVPTFDERQTADFYRHLISEGTVVTLLDHTMAGSYFTYVIQSYDLGVKRAVHYLKDKTDKNLVFIKNDWQAQRNMVQESMIETFIGFVEKSEDSRKAMVVENLFELGPEMIRKNRIGGIFCSDDTDAIRVMGRLRELGISVPRDVVLVSYGNTDLARYFTPAITSMDPHCEEMAVRTAEIIQKHINREDTTYCQFVIQPELVIRET